MLGNIEVKRRSGVAKDEIRKLSIKELMLLNCGIGEDS